VSKIPVIFAVQGGGTLSSSSTLSDSIGNASVTWTLGIAAGATGQVSAIVEGLSGSPIFFHATALPDRPAQLIYFAGNSQIGFVGSPLPISVAAAAQDQYGNPTAGAIIGWSVTSGGGTLTATLDTTDVSGITAVAWIVGTAPGTNRDTAKAISAELLGSPVVFVASTRAGPPATIAIASGNDQEAIVATELTDSFVVQVNDRFDNAVPGVSVVWSVSRGYGSVIPIRTTTDEVGLTSAKMRVGTLAGIDSAQASVSGLSPVSFAARARPGPPERIVTARGDRQSGWPDSVLRDSLGAQLIDHYNNGIPGASIAWTIMEGAGTISPASSQTDDSGFAFAQLRLGHQLGNNSVNATFNGFPPTGFYQIAAVTYSAIDAGTHHTCGIAVDSSAFCWGMNDRGQLGSDFGFDFPTGCPNVCSLSPIRVSGDLRFVSIVAGGLHTCGLTRLGAAYCWGDNGYGQVLGDGSSSVSLSTSPQPVAASISFITLSAGGHHTCGITISGKAYCWGWNQDGQLGDNSTASTRQVVEVAGGLVFTAISAGDRHTCGVTQGGAAYCWGWNVDGQLGIGTQQSDSVPSAIGGIPFLAVEAGERHSCGVSLGLSAYCWGSNAFGQVGNGGTELALVPVSVQGTNDFSAVSTSLQPFTCGKSTTNTVYCWGNNASGQLGNGAINTADPYFSAVPSRVVGGHVADLVSAGAQHACLIDSHAIAWCWGASYLGQLGTGTVSGWTTPQRVAYQLN